MRFIAHQAIERRGGSPSRRYYPANWNLERATAPAVRNALELPVVA
jgi:hypothetical protein